MLGCTYNMWVSLKTSDYGRGLPQAWNTSCSTTENKSRPLQALAHRLREFPSPWFQPFAIIQEQPAKSSFGPKHGLLEHSLFIGMMFKIQYVSHCLDRCSKRFNQTDWDSRGQERDFCPHILQSNKWFTLCHSSLLLSVDWWLRPVLLFLIGSTCCNKRCQS